LAFFGRLGFVIEAGCFTMGKDPCCDNCKWYQVPKVRDPNNLRPTKSCIEGPGQILLLPGPGGRAALALVKPSPVKEDLCGRHQFAEEVN
jgi:hypothetical protein